MTAYVLWPVWTVCLLLAACAGSPYHNAPRYRIPEDRSVAVRQLVESLAFGGLGYHDVGGDHQVLRWREQLHVTEKQRMWLDRELDLQRLRFVAEPDKPGEHWQVRVRGEGGAVTFRFKDDVSAAKASSALMRLSQP